MKAATLKLLFAIIGSRRFYAVQLDAVTAFLNSLIEREIYVEMPHGFQDNEKICRLLKALYGLKQSPRLWYETVVAKLAEFGFHPCAIN